MEPVTTTATTVCNEIPPYIAFAVVPSIQEVQVQKFTYYSGHQPFNDIHKHIIVFIVIVAMVINNKMARRCSLGSRAVGFYMDFEEIPDDSSEGQYYEVERLVDRRIRRVSLLVASYFFL